VSHSLTDLAGLKVSAEDLLAVVMETTAQPICVVDPDGCIRFANPAAVAALGYDSAEELVGSHSQVTIRSPASYVSVPIAMADGHGAVVAFDGVEDHRELREHDALPVGQQASLQRIATLVAGGAASADVFAAIASEVGHVVGLSLVAVARYERDGTATVMGAWSERPHPFQAGTGWPLDGSTIAVEVLKTGHPARLDDFAEREGTIADAAHKAGMRAAAGAPIIVDGEVWGVMATASTDGDPLPDHIEDRLTEFTELVATAISNSAGREELARLADEQAALRRVATLVAHDSPPAQVFAAVAEELGRLLGAEVTTICRYEADRTVTVVAEWGDAAFPVGTRLAVDDENVGGRVLRTGRVARMDDYSNATGSFGSRVRAVGLRSAVGCPIVVDGQLWGVMIAASRQAGTLPAATETRIGQFTELVATAISNTEARTHRGRLADEQAALRRVATLVARGVAPDEVFAAVTEEVRRLLGTGLAGMARYERDTVTVLAAWAAEDGGEHPRVPGPWPLEGGDLASTIATTGRSVRIDSYDGVPGRIAAFVRDELGIKSSVGSPIVVGGRLWGALFVHSRQTEPLSGDTESRLTDFTELVATAIANADARAALAASRARVVVAADETRRQIERDLHDGIQQRLVSLLLELQSAEVIDSLEAGELRAQLARTADSIVEVLAELREISRGIHPVILSNGGLAPAVRGLARRLALPVELDLRAEGRLPELVEVAAYYVVSEALTNAAKHAHASVVNVELDAVDSVLRLAIRDDGVGGADPGQGSGSGLIGLSDRIEALGGTLEVTSRPGDGTTVLVEVPIERSASGA
jgi:signal transduction histidine kinase